MTAMVLVLATLAQDMADNPEFKSWAGFKPGSSVTTKVQNAANPQAAEQKSTLKTAGEAEIVLAVEFSMSGKVLRSNDEIPGRSAKVEITSDAFKTSMVATAWEKK